MAHPIFTRLDRAAKQAMAHQNQIFQFPTDPQLAQYEQLEPVDFDAIAQHYGPEATVQYIQTMESRRLKGANHGK